MKKQHPLRTNIVRSWLFYSLTLGIGLYSHLFFLLNVAAQAVYVSLLRMNAKSRDLFRNYLISLITGVTAFLFWLSLFFIHASNLNKQAKWFGQHLDILTISKRILGNILRTFFDLGFDETTTLKDSPAILLSIFNDSDAPLLISDTFLPRLMPLGYQLNPTTSLQWSTLDEAVDIPDAFQNVYLFGDANMVSTVQESIKANSSDYSLNRLAEISDLNLHLYEVK